MNIDINCDLGETSLADGPGNDEAIMPFISSVNIACGFHAGDPLTIEQTVRSAIRNGVSIRAHPGYPDRDNFGRKPMTMSHRELRAMILYQAGAVKAMAEAAGLLTTVQDKGRYGYQRYGMPVSGAMDTFSLELANLLVGNEPGDACLEATITGPELEFTDATTVAITSSDMDPHLNGHGIPMNTAVDVKSGDRIKFTGLRSGCRSYIAFAGGIAVPLVMGSRSTYLRGGIGGYQGRALMQGDELPLSEPKRPSRIKVIPEGLFPDYKHEQTIRIIPGPEAQYFELAGLRSFLSTEYTVTAQCDRMTYRLSCEPIMHKEGMSSIISAGISTGTIQVPGDGQPIILMADRQTSGGYARIANVITVDLTLLAQMHSGYKIRFKETTLNIAQQLYLDRSIALSNNH